MKRQFVNLVTRNWTERVYSVRRIDPYHHFFYGSAEAALAAAAANKNKDPFPEMRIKELPSPCINFAAPSPGGALDMLALFTPCAATGDGRMVYANTVGQAALYDAHRHVLHPDLGRLQRPKGIRPVCISVAHPGADDDSMYVLAAYPDKGAERCFEVLEPAPRVFRGSCLMPPWCSRLLPPPPFVLQQHGYQDQPSCVTSFTTVVDRDGCSTIYISSSEGGVGGTYSFETARPDSGHRLGWTLSEKWSHVGEWMMPFRGRAHYVPEFDLWFGLSALSPYHHLCATDLSVMADGRQPAAPTVWEDLNPPAEGEAWRPKELELIHLGGGKFLIFKTFAEGEIGGHFSVLTGVEMLLAGAGDDRQQTLQMVKHKCARFVHTDEDIERVL